MKINFVKITMALAIVAGSVVSCDTKKEEPTELHGINLADMDMNVSPKDDFYNFVNGTWMKENEIPDDETRWGGFNILRKQTAENVLDIITRAKESHKYGPETDQGKAVLIYESTLDTIARNELGITPILLVLEKIENMESVADFQKLISEDAVEVRSEERRVGKEGRSIAYQ